MQIFLCARITTGVGLLFCFECEDLFDRARAGIEHRRRLKIRISLHIAGPRDSENVVQNAQARSSRAVVSMDRLVYTGRAWVSAALYS